MMLLPTWISLLFRKAGSGIFKNCILLIELFSYGELLKQVKTNYLIFCRAMRTYQITVLEKHSHEVKTTKWIIPKVSLCSHILFKVGKERKNFDSKFKGSKFLVISVCHNMFILFSKLITDCIIYINVKRAANVCFYILS